MRGKNPEYILMPATAGSALIQACEKAGSVVPRYVNIQLTQKTYADRA